MFRRHVITLAITVAIAVASGLVAGSAQAAGHGGGGGGGGRGGGGGGGGGGGAHGAIAHVGGGGGGGHVGGGHLGAMHAGSLHAGRSGIHSPSHHGALSRHGAVSHRGSSHNATHHAKPTSSHKLASNKLNHQAGRHDKLASHDKLGSRDKLASRDKLGNHDKLASHDKLGNHDRFARNGFDRRHDHDHRFFGRRVFAVWFGPVFWPYAFYDLFDYVFWVCDSYYYYSYGCYNNYGPFWAYGYNDLFGGIYGPYGYAGNSGGYAGDYRGYGSSDRNGRRRQVARSDPSGAEPRGARADELAQLCGGEAASLVHFPFDRIEQKVQPTDAQRASFEQLRSAAAQAADKLKASCPSEPAFGPLGRLDTAEQRLEAMLDAMSTVRGPLMKFYDSLDDQQKARLDAMGLSPGREADGGRQTQAGVVPRICSERSNEISQLSIEQIEKNVHPTDAQRAELEDLRDASARAADAIKASCPSQTPLTVPARIEAVEGRLRAMLDALKTVRGPLEKFYASLDDEQRARFNRMSQTDRRAG